MNLLGFDIGGTKCAVIYGQGDADNVEIIEKIKMPTDLSITPEEMIQRLIDAAKKFPKPDYTGVSCGGPLSSETGVIMGPPNLPGWDDVHIVEILEKEYGVPSGLQNDANACALAEWRYGAGRGTKNMAFLTFGTGLGAGLILDGRLYAGTNDNAGECGHIRLADEGPVGFGKAGSFEGFCSGGGIAQIGKALGEKNPQCAFYGDYTAKAIGDAAEAGDETALEVYKISGEMLGRGLSILIDLLNPQKIVIGSIFERSRDLLWPHCKKYIDKEALGGAAAVCEVVPAALGNSIGDYAALITAAYKTVQDN